MTNYILISFILWRILLFLFAYLGNNVLAFLPRFPYSEIYLTSSGLPPWIWSFANFDGVHYLTIAKSGYSAQFTQVFFPFYPLIIGLIGKFISFINPLLIGLILSNLFFIMAIFIFNKLLALDYKKHDVKKIIVFLLIFPVSFFFGSLYTESLFLFFVLSSFYMARKKRWWLASISGGLASATRLVGIFLLPALLWELYQSSIKYQVSSIKYKSKLKYLILNTKYLILSPVFLIVPLGLIFYMVYLQINFHDALYFWHAQPVFGAERSGGSIVLLPQVIWRYIKIFKTVSIYSESFWIPMIEFISLIGSIWLLIFSTVNKMRFSYLVFSWLTVLTPTLTGTLSSLPRYLLPAFSIYIVLGLIRNNIVKYTLFVIFILLLFSLTVLFTRGHWVA